MPRASIAAAILTLTTSFGVLAQTVIIPPNTTVFPGSPFTVLLINNTPDCVDPLVSNVLVLMQPSGEIILPELFTCGSVAQCINGGGTASLNFSTPAAGPGSFGSFLLLCPYGSGAATRLDVSAATPNFPDIHAYPRGLPSGGGGTRIDLTVANDDEWEFANTASQARTIAPVISVFTPGATSPLAVFPFTSVTVPSGGVARVVVPFGTLAPGPYTVEATWNDPGTNSGRTVRHGVQVAGISTIDLGFPGGRTIPFGGSITAWFVYGNPNPLVFLNPPSYAFCIGVTPGSTALPNGLQIPLVNDVLVQASLQNGLFGLLSNNIGVPGLEGAFCAHSLDFYWVARGLSVSHPNDPALSGVRVRAAAFLVDSMSGEVLPSQPEVLTLN